MTNFKSLPIVIVGGGFGGISTVKTLLSQNVDTPIILIDESPRFVFKPLLYELLSDEIQLWEVAPTFSSLANELGFIFLQDSVIEVDEAQHKIVMSSQFEMQYAQLVISTGMTTDYLGIDGLRENIYGFSNLRDVDKIKRLINRMKSFTANQPPLIIVGAGPTGVELACKIADLTNDFIDIYLIDMSNKILPKCKFFNQEKSIEALLKRNIKIHLNTVVKSINEDSLEFHKSDEFNQIHIIKYSALILTAGLVPNSINLFSKYKKNNKRIILNDYLQINDHKNIFFVGDNTLNKNNPWPSSAQVAMQQGFATGQNICSLRNGEVLKSFEFEDRGEMLSLGLSNASITGYGITLAGPIAFEIRRLAYLMLMPGLSLSWRSAGSWLFGKKLMSRLFSKSS